MKKFTYIFFALFCCHLAHSAQWARVSKEVAYIYSDLQMQSIIGKVYEGRRVRVGEVQRNDGQLLPIVVGEKVAYIRIEDINFEKEESNIELQTVKRLRDAERPKNVQRLMLLGGGQSAQAQHSVKDFTKKSFNLLSTGGGVQAYYHNLVSGKIYRGSLEFFQGSNGELSFDRSLAMANFTLDYFWWGREGFGLYSGVILTPYAQLDFQDLFKVNGYGAGIEVGGEIGLPLGKNFQVVLDGSGQYVYLRGFQLPSNNAFPDDLSINYFAVKVFVGLSWTFFSNF